MVRVGIIGNESVYETGEILYHLFSDKGLSVTAVNTDSISDMLLSANNDIFIFMIYMDGHNFNQYISGHYDILIVNEMSNHARHLLANCNIDSNVTIINSDDKDISKSIINNGSRIITYGFNGKACITASSITDSSVLFCIQRALSTFTGQPLVQQEFSVSMEKPGNDIHSVMGAVTAALVNDIGIEFISSSVHI